MKPNTLIPFIEALAEKSAAVILPWFFNENLAVETKTDASPVTMADRQAEEIMRDMIRRQYPTHGIIGEEYGSHQPDAEFTWVLDPIDGTKSFASGCPLFGTLICLTRRGIPIIGAIHLPVLQQLCIGDGQRTTVNNRPVRMRPTADLSAAVLLTTDFLSIEKYQSYDNFDRLMRMCKFTRTWGDCYGYFLLAAGWADIMLDPIMNPWDLLALVPIIRGAGGVITDWQGNDAVTGTSAVAANAPLHPEVIRILNAHAPTHQHS